MLTRKAFLAGAISLCAFPALSGHSDVSVEGPFARATASAAVKVGGVYMRLTNHGVEGDRLIAVEAPEAASRIELHAHVKKDGVMSMVEVAGGIPLPKGETVVLKPGGFHIMMMGLKAPLVKDEHLELTLIFEKAQPIPLSVPILGPGAMTAKSRSHGHGSDHGSAHGQGHGQGHGMGHDHAPSSGHSHGS